MTLYINSCVRENSRTDKIAKALLKKLGNYTEVRLNDEKICPMTTDVLEKRNQFIQNSDYSDPMFRYAKQFANADIIVISAPYWDLSFPANLKAYIENVCVMGIASRYDENGVTHGLCKAKKLYYVTTSGGAYIPDYSYNQIKALAKQYFGIPETILIKGEFLDIAGNNPQKIVEKIISEILNN